LKPGEDKQNQIVLVWIKFLLWLHHLTVITFPGKTTLLLQMLCSSLSLEAAWNKLWCYRCWFTPLDIVTHCYKYITVDVSTNVVFY